MILPHDTICGTIDEQHCDGCKEVCRAEGVDEVRKEAAIDCNCESARAKVYPRNIHILNTTMTRHMVGSVREDAQKFPRGVIQIHARAMALFEGCNHNRDDTVDGLPTGQDRKLRGSYWRTYLLDNPETVCIVPMKDV